MTENIFKTKDIKRIEELVLWNTVDDYYTNELLKLAAKKVNRQSNNIESIDDLSSIGKLKIIEAYPKYNPIYKGKSSSFGAFVHTIGINAMRDHVKKIRNSINATKQALEENNWRFKNRNSFEEVTEISEKELRLDILTEQEEERRLIEKISLQYKVQQVVEVLPHEVNPELIRLRFGLYDANRGNEYTVTEICKMTGMTRRELDQQTRIYESFFKKVLEKEGEKFTAGGKRGGGKKVIHRARKTISPDDKL